MKLVWSVYTVVPAADEFAVLRTKWTEEGPGEGVILAGRYPSEADAKAAAEKRQVRYDRFRAAMAA